MDPRSLWPPARCWRGKGGGPTGGGDGSLGQNSRGRKHVNKVNEHL
jgi:hypothetical protein